MKTLKKNQVEVQELKNLMNDMKIQKRASIVD